MSLSRNSTRTFFTLVATTCLGVLTRATMTHGLGPDGMGIYSLVTVTPIIAFTFASLGLNVANIYYTGNSKLPVEKIIGNSMVLSLWLGGGIGTFIAASAYIPQLAFLMRGVPLPYVLISAASIPIIFGAMMFNSIVQGRNLISAFNSISLLSTSFMFCATAVTVTVFGLGTVGAVTAWFGMYVVTLLVSAKVCRGFSRLEFKFDRHTFAVTTSFGLKSYLANLFGILVKRTDVFLVSNILGTAKLGIYSLGVTAAEMILMPSGAISTVLLPFVAAGISENPAAVSAALVRLTFWGTALICLGSMLFDWWLIPLVFGAPFAASVLPFRLLLPGIAAGAVERVLAQYLIGVGLPHVTLVSAFTALAVNVPLNLWLIPKLGIGGAAVSSAISLTVAMLITALWFVRITGLRLADLFALRAADLRLALAKLVAMAGKA